MSNLPSATTRLISSSASASGQQSQQHTDFKPKIQIAKKKEPKKSLPSRVAQAYYKHGLFLSSYPTCATSIAIVVVLFCCYPLVNIPLPGTIPTKIVLPYSDKNSNDDTIKPSDGTVTTPPAHDFNEKINNLFTLSNFSFEPPFPWARSEPFVYVQQIVLRSTVAPWTDDLILTDAFRSPLYEVFNLVELIRNHEDETTKNTLGHICLHVENVKRGSAEAMFPQYNCLMLSPANFWQQNVQTFNKDPTILATIFNQQNLQKTKVSTAEMLLGMKIRDTGLKRYPIRPRSRIIQYAITLVIRENDKSFLTSLKTKLQNKYTLHKNMTGSHAGEGTAPIQPSTRQSIIYVYYPGEFNVMEFLPLFIAFVSLFLYVYFSLRKIDVIRSRMFLSISSVITVLASLAMSISLCFFFGLTINMQSKVIYPYLVIIVGLENVLVITKSVVSIDETLDLKIRLAKGLSMEGWSITKNLMTEITILTIGLATFVPVIQEFCIFAIVGLISDFFLQMIFFSTILALDIKKIEYSAEVKHMPKSSSTLQANGVLKTKNHIKYPSNAGAGCVAGGGTMNRSRSHPKLSNLEYQTKLSTDVVATPTPSNSERKLPKRVRLFNFWARTRFFQRAFMIWMMVWISTIIYNSGLVEHLFFLEHKVNNGSDGDIGSGGSGGSYGRGGGAANVPIRSEASQHVNDFHESLHMKHNSLNENLPKMTDENFQNFTEYLKKLRFTDYDTSFSLSNFHWASILKQYNISMSGRYVTILPSIRLSHCISPEVALTLQNQQEKMKPNNFQWKAFAAALDPIDFGDADQNELPLSNPGSMPLYPKSPMEIFLTAILCGISVFFLAYLMVVLYRCICSRNYAEWRASWNNKEENMPRTQKVLTCVTLQVKGHAHSIDCLAVDGSMVASTCLEGRIKIWNAQNGELMADINRTNTNSLGFMGKPINTNYNNNSSTSSSSSNSSPIWCLDYLFNLIVIGCADGRLEFWEGTTEKFKCVYQNEMTHNDGVTHVKLAADKVVAARLSGRVDILKLGTYTRGIPIDYNFSSVYRRTHVRAGSTGSMSSFNQSSSVSTTEELKCFLECQHEGHQQPITCLEVADGIALTGSQDHTLKVFKLETASLVYTLHGHYGPITCLFIDSWQRGTGGSGSEDGLLYVWDLIAGAGMYKIEAHNGPIVSVVCAPSYVISLGSDGRLCVWERFQLNLLNTITVANTYSSLLMLTSSLLVRAKPGALIVLDVRTGETAGEAELDDSNLHICPKIMLSAGDTVVCDYGNQLRIVTFPLITSDKCD